MSDENRQEADAGDTPRDAAQEAESEGPAGRALTAREQDQVKERRRLSAMTVYAILHAEGEEELRRPVRSLWWSGVAAGIAISTSLLAEGLLYNVFEGHPRREFIAWFGYSAGFIIVILSRLQLFTENTISALLPLLAEWSTGRLWRMMRLWAIVFVANLLGTFATAFITLELMTTGAANIEAMLELSRKAVEIQDWRALLLGVPAGFYIAALVWLLPSSKSFEIFTIIFISWLIAAGGFTHVIVGSSKVFMVVLSGELSLLTALLHNILPVLVGNVIGGSGLFAMLAYAQVSQEM
ncbi:formate/nitrite transporter family protein [Roseovarius spongiae]|uniref:Formate/nitrite transporter family protein n=1 Tax=Roseovarius spongiae TaxID=2320272 RepID=A0A3A8B7H9_9RHOB|nr:formate/nitrite transporter family protein [Roseovarius spongiae]RKF12611.1 formate/nitrite transporter family protein [Roseovarius spongiae]